MRIECSGFFGIVFLCFCRIPFFIVQRKFDPVLYFNDNISSYWNRWYYIWTIPWITGLSATIVPYPQSWRTVLFPSYSHFHLRDFPQIHSLQWFTSFSALRSRHGHCKNPSISFCQNFSTTLFPKINPYNSLRHFQHYAPRHYRCKNPSISFCLRLPKISALRCQNLSALLYPKRGCIASTFLRNSLKKAMIVWSNTPPTCNGISTDGMTPMWEGG